MNENENIKIVTIAGTRPEIIKLSSLIPLLYKYNHIFLYTGQHYSDNMKDIFFDELDLKPDIDLKCNTSDVPTIKDNLIKVLNDIHPNYIQIYGDTNSSMAAALAAKELDIRLIHIEAGVRDFDLAVPEESIRIFIDSISDYLFVPSKLSQTILTYEDVKGKVFFTGNLIVDVCMKLSTIAKQKYYMNYNENEYVLLTIHRPENSDDPLKLEKLVNHLKEIKYQVVFPIHPRTKNNLEKYELNMPNNVRVINAVGYLEFLNLLMNCKLVLTDSGGVQEESIILKKPCITLRHTSARWETILLKNNMLFPLDRTDSLNDVIESMVNTKINKNPYGENVAYTIINILDKILKNNVNENILRP